MDLHLLLALVMFCTIMAITPGPNNLLLASCGFNFGLRRLIAQRASADAWLVGFNRSMAVLLLAWGVLMLTVEV